MHQVRLNVANAETSAERSVTTSRLPLPAKHKLSRLNVWKTPCEWFLQRTNFVPVQIKFYAAQLPLNVTGDPSTQCNKNADYFRIDKSTDDYSNSELTVSNHPCNYECQQRKTARTDPEKECLKTRLIQ
jgi:hypothetical protein